MLFTILVILVAIIALAVAPELVAIVAGIGCLLVIVGVVGFGVLLLLSANGVSF